MVKVGGVRTLFRMPDLLSIGLGGGSHVSLDPLKVDGIGRLPAAARAQVQAVRFDRLDGHIDSIGHKAKPRLAAFRSSISAADSAMRQPPARHALRGAASVIQPPSTKIAIGGLIAFGHRTAPLSQRAPDRVAEAQERRELALSERRRAFEHRVDHRCPGRPSSSPIPTTASRTRRWSRTGAVKLVVAPLKMAAVGYSGLIHERACNTRVMPIGDEAIAEAARLVLAGEPVAVPTETVYGLAADATNAAAVRASTPPRAARASIR